MIRTSVNGFVLVAAAGASAVLLGAFGAHALHDVLSPAQQQTWHTAVEYHFWYALALALTVTCAPGRGRRIAIACFTGGIALFCGSLYALALGAPLMVGFVTPIGGLAFMVGWPALGSALHLPR